MPSMKFWKLLSAYFSPMALGAIGAVLGGGAALSELLGGGVSTPNIYQPQGMSQADLSFLSGLSNSGAEANQLYNTVSPLAGQSLDAATSLNWAPYISAANTAAGQLGAQGAQLGANAGALSTAGQAALGQQSALYNAGQQLYNLGMDPQSALYARTLSQLQNQSNATASQFGLGQSGAGASLTNQNLENFNIDWQNQALSRAQAGLSGLTSADQAGAQQASYGADLLGGAASSLGQQAQSTLQAGQIPLQAQQQAAAYPGQAAATYAGQIQSAMAPQNQAMGQALSYLGYGTGAQSTAAQTGLSYDQFNAQQQQGAMAGLTSALGNFSDSSLGSSLNSSLNGYFGLGSTGGGTGTGNTGVLGSGYTSGNYALDQSLGGAASNLTGGITFGNGTLGSIGGTNLSSGNGLGGLGGWQY